MKLPEQALEATVADSALQPGFQQGGQRLVARRYKKVKRRGVVDQDVRVDADATVAMRQVFVFYLDGRTGKVIETLLVQHAEQRLVVGRGQHGQPGGTQDADVRPIVALAGAEGAQVANVFDVGQQLLTAFSQQRNAPAYQALVQRNAHRQKLAFALLAGHGP